MMSPYKSQGIATKKFGITFRSKLEAAWAYALSELKDVRWDYVDSPWHDFVIHAPWGEVRIEVKPIGALFFLEAIERMPDGETVYVVQGEPTVVGEWSVAVDEAVRCVFRKSVHAVYQSQWRSFEIGFLEAMFHATRSFPIYSDAPMFSIEEYRHWANVKVKA